MLVEDEEAVRRTISGQLKALGHEVKEFPDGETAFAELDCAHYDLILTDIVMPGIIQGSELAERVRRCCPELPVILMTGYATAQPDAKPAFAGDGVRLMKPLSSSDLAEAIQAVLSDK